MHLSLVLLLPCLTARGLVLSDGDAVQRTDAHETNRALAADNLQQDVSNAESGNAAVSSESIRNWLFTQLARPLGGTGQHEVQERLENKLHGHALEDEVDEDMLWAEPEAFLVKSQRLRAARKPRFQLLSLRGPISVGIFAGREWLLFWILAILNYFLVMFVAAVLWSCWLRDSAEEDTFVTKKFLEFICNEEKDEEALHPSSPSLLSNSFISALGVHRRKATQLHRIATELYYEDNWRQVIRAGARTLFFTTLMMMTYRLVRLIWSPSCIEPYYALRFSELAVLVVVLGGCLHCVLEPRKLLYMCLVLFFFFYIPAITLPPFMWSCCELEKGCSSAVAKEAASVRHGSGEKTLEKIFTEERYIADSVMEVDCSLQGQTAQQMFMTWLLLLPWIIPTFNLLMLTWGWVWGIYLGWTMLWQLVNANVVCEKSFALHQVILRLILLSATLVIALRKKTDLEKAQVMKYMAQLRSNQNFKNNNTILRMMMPKDIAERMIMEPGKPVADPIDCVSILFVVIDGFDEYASKHPPQEVLKYLNRHFKYFDKICSDCKVTKIESVKEEYVCCVGVLKDDIDQNDKSGHASILAKLFKAANEMLLYAADEEFNVKMGLHTGKIVAGVVGADKDGGKLPKLPRYRLFGDTINTTARMMQRGKVGKLQFGTATYEQLPDCVLAKDNGLVQMKGKGEVQTYIFTGLNVDADTYGEQPECPSSPGGSPAQRGSRRRSTRTDQKGRRTEGQISQRLMQLSGDVLSNADEQQVRQSISEFGRLEELEKLVKKHESDTSAKGVIRKVFGKLFPHIFNSQEKLAPEMEAAWYRKHHEQHFIRKVTAKLDKTVALLAVWSVVHAGVMIGLKIFLKQISFLTGFVDVTMFILCRGMQIGILIGLRQAAKGKEDFRNDPFRFQTTTLVCYVVVAFLSYMSFQALTYHPEVLSGKKEFGEMQAPIDQFFTLVFMLEYCILTARHPFLFVPSLAFLFLAILLMTSADVVTQTVGIKGGLYFPMMGEFLFVVITFLNCINAYEAEQCSRADYRADSNIEESKGAIDDILGRLMPKDALEELRLKTAEQAKLASDVVPAPLQDSIGHKLQRATIAQSDLCGFTKLANKRTAEQVVSLISELFATFDALTDKYGIYKIETVGDAYIAGKAEQILSQDDSAYSVVLFGLDMIDACQVWAINKKVKVNCRVGVHHGECIGGVVGQEMQRYHIFGELMSGLEILESTSEEGKVQISKACKDAIDTELATKTPEKLAEVPGVAEWQKEDWTLNFKERDVEKLVTSKGESFQLSEVGGKTFLVSVTYE
mmetsp:Transcript_35823/g.82225  ORF Transcript_35823/g.82225 Transcript_35823/m.82225 type:complete len:1299 (-) Transcript_35823:60-3956(-)